MSKDELEQEYLKCLKDPIYFIENHVLVNNKKIKLSKLQKQAIIKWIEQKDKNYVLKDE